MDRLEAGLNSAVTSGELTATQRDSWQAALHKAANTMVDTPGLHVAGKACAT
jgi:hypothetical protein